MKSFKEYLLLNEIDSFVPTHGKGDGWYWDEHRKWYFNPDGPLPIDDRYLNPNWEREKEDEYTPLEVPWQWKLWNDFMEWLLGQDGLNFEPGSDAWYELSRLIRLLLFHQHFPTGEWDQWWTIWQACQLGDQAACDLMEDILEDLRELCPECDWEQILEELLELWFPDWETPEKPLEPTSPQKEPNPWGPDSPFEKQPFPIHNWIGNDGGGSEIPIG